MELEMLKEKWNELDNRLANVESLNKVVVKELIKNKTRSSIDYLYRRDLYGVFCCVLISAVILGYLMKNAPISQTSGFALTFICIFGAMASIYRAQLLSKYKITDPSVSLLKITLQYKRFAAIEKVLTIPVVLVCIGIFFYCECSWMIPHGVVVPAAAFTIFIAVVACVGTVVNYRRCSTILQTIEEALSELKDVE